MCIAVFLPGRRGAMYIAKGSDVYLGVSLISVWSPLGSVAFVWQVWNNLHCHGVGCTPWRPSGVPLASRWRPSDVFLTSVWRRLVYFGLRCFAWHAWNSISELPSSCTHYLLCTALYLRSRHETICIANGLYTAFLWHSFGIPLTSFWHPSDIPYVAAVGQCAVPRGRIYALASL